MYCAIGCTHNNTFECGEYRKGCYNTKLDKQPPKLTYNF